MMNLACDEFGYKTLSSQRVGAFLSWASWWNALCCQFMGRLRLLGWEVAPATPSTEKNSMSILLPAQSKPHRVTSNSNVEQKFLQWSLCRQVPERASWMILLRLEPLWLPGWFRMMCDFHCRRYDRLFCSVSHFRNVGHLPTTRQKSTMR